MSAFAFKPLMRTGFMLAPTYPNQWERTRLRFVCEFNPSKRQIADLDPSTPVSFVPMEKVSEDGVMRLDDERPIEAVSNGFTFFADGDVVVAKITPCFENGKGAECKGLTNGFGFGTTEFHVLRSKDLDSRYLFYITASDPFRTIGATEMSGAAGQKRVPESFLQNLIVPLPPLPTQRRIAAYLDRETAQIDALVAEKEALLGLLEEKRGSLISHAVTRGLNPKAKLKPSGIPWLGDVPVHWEVKRIKHLANIIRGKFTYRPRNAPHLYNGPFPFIQTGDVARADKYITSHTQTLSEAGYDVSKEFPKGTLCMTIAANVGDVAILEFDACFPDSVVGFRPSASNSVDYLYYLFLSLRPQLLETSVVSTQANLNIDRVGTLKVAVPPLDEQRITAAFLAKLDKGTSQLRSEIQTSITLLREKRSSLISAAVTGEMAVP